MTLEERFTALEQRVQALEAQRPGRKKIPVIASEAGICGIDPQRDSASCPDASIYRRQQGCKGAACMSITAAYWANYRRLTKPS